MGATASELEALYRVRYHAFLRLASAISGSQARGADAVQDAFVRALGARHSYRGRGTLEAWVWRIVVNAARAARPRAEDAQPLAETSVRALDDPDPLGVHAWVARLPERERLVVFLRYFADLDYRSIASALEIEVGTVSATLHSAHATLRRSLEEAAR
jgi:RNA polymerase sigma-70 factor (ECF subfamily)